MISGPFTLCVAGDTTLDWNLAHLGESVDQGRTWTVDEVTRACGHPGGAALTTKLIEAVAAEVTSRGGPEWSVLGPVINKQHSLQPDDGSQHHCYSMWRPFASSERDENGKPVQVWRVERFLGLDKAAASGKTKPPTNLSHSAKVQPRIVVLDNGDLGFRDRPELWPKAIEHSDSKPWVVLKMPPPVLAGGLFEHVAKHCGDKLIVVMTIDYLRRSEVQISRGLSWERTAEDLIRELTTNPKINAALRCAHTVVSLGNAGAFLLSCEPSADPTSLLSTQGRLIYDPRCLEGEWEPRDSGLILGSTTTLTASIVRQLMSEQTDAPSIAASLQTGIAATRRLHTIGYGFAAANTRPCPEFPWEDIARTIEAVHQQPAVERALRVTLTPTIRLKERPAAPSENQPQARSRSKPQWRIGMTPVCENPEKEMDSWKELNSQHRALAVKLAVEGVASSGSDIPVAEFGDLATIDREEAEALRSIRNLMREYIDGKQNKPLSVAVFGPPGSGKSFGIEQVAQTVQPGLVEKLTFNLSQFASSRELHGALHRVRDAGLKGKLPLVFWDEFDTTVDGRPLGWLRYFLAPMQDGEFQEDQIVHPIGRAVFVFAGGTSADLAGFGQKLTEEQLLAVKHRDFVSRLKGYLNVRGPNRQREAPDGDPFFILRRAQLLRSMLLRHAKRLFEGAGDRAKLRIDPGVLRALLNVREYKHGARSLESILLTSMLIGKSSFLRSSLPASEQLELHVPSEEFRDLVQELTMTDEVLETLARAAHEVFCRGKERDGWKYGEQKSAEKKTHPLLVDYAKLPEEYKESNRRTVRDIPKKLARIGYVMVATESGDPHFGLNDEQVETLAEYEHELWMDAQLTAGFTPGKPTPDDPLRNESLVPWTDLPNDIKQIDRDLVRGIPEILQVAGYTAKRVS